MRPHGLSVERNRGFAYRLIARSRDRYFKPCIAHAVHAGATFEAVHLIAAYLCRQRRAGNELTPKIDDNAKAAFRMRHDAQREPFEKLKGTKGFYGLLEKERLARTGLPQQGIFPQRVLKSELQEAHSDRVPFGRVTDERQFNRLVRSADRGDRPDQRDVIGRIGIASRRQEKCASIAFKRGDRRSHLPAEAIDDPVHIREKLGAVSAQADELIKSVFCFELLKPMNLEAIDLSGHAVSPNRSNERRNAGKSPRDEQPGSLRRTDPRISCLRSERRSRRPSRSCTLQPR